MKMMKLAALIVLLALVVTACGQESEPEDIPAAEVEPGEGSDSAEEPVAEQEPVSAEEQPDVEEQPAADIQTEPGSADETASASVSGGDLTGSIWTLTELNGEAPLPATSITAEFTEDGRVGGSAGCNSYSAAYEVDGDSITFEMGQTASTMMACLEPVMAQESAYFQALAAAETYEINVDTLILYDSSGTPVATFSAVSQGLVGSSWEVISYNNGKGGVVSVIIDTQITADFGDNGNLTGFAGCNNYFGDYVTSGENIAMGPFGTTRKACQEPEGAMDQEFQYLAALETAATYKIDGLTMNMRTTEGATVANFRRMLPKDEQTTEPQGEVVLSPEQISLNTESLATSWQAVLVPETPYDQSMPPGPVGMPAHIQILFGGTTDPNEVTPTDPVMYIIPVNSYRKLWNDAGNDSVTRMMQQIQDLNFSLPSPAPTSGYPALPYEQIGGGVNDIAVQLDRAVAQNELNTSSATQNGYRFVGRWAQDANLVSNHGPRYVYQGFTNDGVYLVSFWWPVTTEALPDSSEITDEQVSAFHADPSAALENAAESLNTLSTDQWDPDLAALDAVVASLEIEGMVAAGLVDKPWQWTQGPAQPGSTEIVTIADPSLYQVTYGSDGTMVFVADCNSGHMSYDVSIAGMTGSMLAQPGPVTLAACGAESYSDAFIASLQASQSYRVWAGGNEMELVLPAGGGVLMLRDANAPSTEVASSSNTAAVSGMVTFAGDPLIVNGASAAIQIQDTSLADAPATVIGETIVENPGQFPIAYEVTYDPTLIEENHTYTMSARITAADGSLLYINDTAISVITRGTPTENVEIPVIQTGG